MMKKIIYRISISLVTITFLVFFYFNTNYFIRKQEWKHGSGSSIGDFLLFEYKENFIKGRTIYMNGIPTGRIIFCAGKKLIIKEIRTGESCYYINKSNFQYY